jgi:hypothetical protein
MKFLKVAKKNVLCDGCSRTDAKHKLKFNEDEDAVFMCETCFAKLQNALRSYTQK